MLCKRIIPCLDVRNGLVVKGVQFKNHEVMGDITELAAKYSQMGADELVFYDISASTEDKTCLLYTSPSPRDGLLSRMPSSA